MAIALSNLPASMHPAKRVRRTATAVMAGAFDWYPPRDVLTSLLNGVPSYQAVEGDDARREKKRRRKERRQLKEAKARQLILAELPDQTPSVALQFASSSKHPQDRNKAASASSFWRSRPRIDIPTIQRSVSVTPPPATSPLLFPSTPRSSPGRSISSSTSRTSSKRPHTPDEDEDLHSQNPSLSAPMTTQIPRERKKRVAAKKGWKGWVEGSPPPSEKLINLDAVPVLQERRTRSGKNFDAIGVGKEGSADVRKFIDSGFE